MVPSLPRGHTLRRALRYTQGLLSIFRSVAQDFNKMWYVYILQCSGNSYYVGITDNLERRIKEYQAGQGGSYTSKRIPVKLKYNESYKTREEAERRERQLKGWSKAKKEALIRKDKAMLHQLSRSKS